MREELATWLSSHGIPPTLTIFIFAMTPIFELRGSIPVAKFVFNLPFLKTYLFSVAGNIIPAIPILLFLEPVSNFLRNQSSIADRFFYWLFARTRYRTEEKIEKYGALGLILFVAIPLPVTGAWTGCIAGFIFGIRFRYAFPAIIAGVLIAGIVVSIVTYGTSTVLGLIF